MPRKRIVKIVRRKDPNRPGHTIEKEVIRKVSTKAPKKPKISQKQKTRQFLEKAGLHKTKRQRKAMEHAMERVLGYRPQKLSDLVKKPSRHTVKERQPLYEVKKEFRPGEHKFVGYEENRWGEYVPRYEFVPGRERVTEKKLIGERIVAKRLSKKGAGTEGGTRERGSKKKSKKPKYKRQGKRGQKARREKTKKKKKKR